MELLLHKCGAIFINVITCGGVCSPCVLHIVSSVVCTMSLNDCYVSFTSRFVNRDPFNELCAASGPSA